MKKNPRQSAKKILSVLISALFICVSASFALDDISGLQWMELSAGQKMDRIRMSMAVLGYNGVKLKHTANDYYNDVSQRLRIDPNLFSWELTRILAVVAAEKELDAKLSLEKYKHTFRV